MAIPTMQENVARALVRAGAMDFDKLDGDKQNYWRKLARCAIEGAREPTPQAMEFALKNSEPDLNGADIRAAYEAVVSAALLGF